MCDGTEADIMNEKGLRGWEVEKKGRVGNTSNGGCRREEKSCKRRSLFTELLSSVTATLFIC